jgi:hypothetical protein
VAPGETFLRGAQRTDERGVCAFHTIYPGGTPAGRCTSTFELTLASGPRQRSSTSRMRSPTGVFTVSPGRPGRDTTNGNDSIFTEEGGAGKAMTTPASWLRCYRCWSQNLEVQVHLRGRPQGRRRHRRGQGCRGGKPRGGRSVHRLPPRPAAPRLLAPRGGGPSRRTPRGDRGPLGAPRARDAVGRLVHGHCGRRGAITSLAEESRPPAAGAGSRRTLGRLRPPP